MGAPDEIKRALLGHSITGALAHYNHSSLATEKRRWRREIQRVWDDNQQVSGPRKVWRQLRRDGHRVARCTVGRLMRAMGLRGAVRGRAWVTTTPGRTAVRIGRLTSSPVTSWRPGPINDGSRTSPTSRRGGASSTSPSSSTCSRDALSAGACRRRSARTSSSMRLSRPSTIVAVTARATWCITATAACRVNSTGRRNTLMMRCCDAETETEKVRPGGAACDAFAWSAAGRGARGAAPVLEGDRPGAVE